MNKKFEEHNIAGYNDFLGFCTELQNMVLEGWRVSQEMPNGWATATQQHIRLEKEIPEDVVLAEELAIIAAAGQELEMLLDTVADKEQEKKKLPPRRK